MRNPILFFSLAFSLLLTQSSIAQITFDNVPPLSGGGNTGGGAGYVFNFTTNENIIIHNFRGAFNNVSGIATVYYNQNKVNGAPGGTSTIFADANWIELGSAEMTGQTTTSSNPIVQTIPVTFDLFLNAGDTIGVILYWTGSVHPTQNTNIPTFSDGTVTIIADASCAFTFNNANSFTPRQVNGGVIYSLATPCSGTPDAGTAVAPTIACENLPFDLSLSGNTLGTGLTYQWMSSPTASGPWTPIAGATSLNVSVTQSEDTYYACVVECTNSSLSDTSAAVFVETTPSFPAGTYYIGATGDFPDFNSAIDAISCGIAGSVVFNVMPGSGPYFEQVIIGEIGGTGPNSTITFNGNGNTLQFLSTNTNERATLKMKGTSYVTFDSLHILALGTGTVTGEFGYAVQLMDETNHLTFTNCTFEASIFGTSANFGAFIASNSNTSALIAGIAASNLTVTNCTMIGGNYGVVIMGPTSAPFAQNNVISNNTILSYAAQGLRFQGQENGVFDRNNISRDLRTNNVVTYGIWMGESNPGTVVSNNDIHNPLGASASSTSAAYPIYGNGASGLAGNPLNVFNNLVYNVNTIGIQYGIYFIGTATGHVNVYHNTVSLANTDATGTSAIRGFFQSVAGTGPVEVRNNIFHITNGNSGIKTGIYLTNNDANVTTSNNVISLQSTEGTNNIGHQGSTAYETLAEWQAVGFDLNSIAVNPAFIDDILFLTPQTGAVSALGVNLNTVAPFDYYGVERPAQPSAGAIQFEPPACAAPGGITAIASDVSMFLSWFENSPSVAFNYEYGPEGYTQGSGTSGVTVGTSVNITGLTSQTSYDFYVQAICGMGINSGWAGPFTFSTLCNMISGTVTLGTPTSDFENFTALTDYFNCGGVNGHLTVVVEPNSGPFNEKVEFSAIPGASDTSTITIIGNGNTVNFSPTVTGDRTTMVFDGASYITVQDLHIISSPTSTFGWGILITNLSQFITIDNCIVETDVTQTGTLYAGIVVSTSATGATTAGFAADNITLTNNEVIGGYYGIAFNAASSGPGSSNNVIENNLVRDFHLYGIYLRGLSHSSVHNNEITRPNRTTTGSFYGIYSVAGDYQGTNISSNRIHNSLGLAASSTNLAYPLYISGVSGTTVDPVNIYNNIVYNMNTDGTQYGIYILGTGNEHLNIYHNTLSFANSEATGSSVIRGFFFSVAGGPVDLRNNIFHFNNGNSSVHTGIYITNAGANVTSNNNVISMVSTSSTANNIGFFGGNVYSTLADWQGAGFDSLSVTDNPFFQDEINAVIPQNANIKGIGANLSSIVDVDINGTVRPSNPDPGAYEFTPPSCLMITDFNAPVISDVYAWLNWNDISEGQLWNIEYGPAGFTPGTGTVIIADSTSIMISGLVSLASYDIYIQADCGSGDLSGWAGPYTITTLCPPFPAGTYTLGGPDPDYTSYSAFFADLYCGGIAGPVVLNVMTDTVYEQVEILNVPLTSATNTITINGNGSMIDFAPTVSAERFTLRVSGASHIIFDNLHIRSSGTGTFGWAVHLNELANNITFEGCTIDIDIAQTGTGFAGIVGSTSPTTATTAGLSASHITINNCYFSGGYYAIILNGPSSAPGSLNNVITNNTIVDYNFYGMYLRSLENSVIDGNEMTRQTRTNASAFYGIAGFGSGWAGTSISNNWIHNAKGMVATSTSLAHPLYFNGVAGTEEQPLNIFNNLVYNINNEGVQYGIYLLGTATEHLNIFHNTVSLAHTESTGTSAIRPFFFSVAGGPVNLMNNIFHVNNGNAGEKTGIYITNAGAIVNSNNNVISLAGGSGTNNIGFFGGTAYETLENWQAAGFDSLSVAENPVFQDEISVVIPQNGNIKSIGADLTSVAPFDFNGVERPETPDPGAFQFDPPTCLFVSDLAVAALFDTHAWISWTDNSNAISWNFEYGLTGFEQGSGTMAVADSTAFLIDNLTSQVTYDVYVQAVCGAGIYSGWTGPLSFTTLCPPLPAGTYTLGGAEPDFVSFTQFFEALYCGGIAGPVVLNVEQAYTFEQLDVFPIPLTSTTNTVTINGNGNVLDFAPTVTGDRSTIRFSGASHVIFDNLHIKSSGTGTFGWGIHFTDMASHITINNCIVENNTDQTGTGFAGIVGSTSQTTATTAGMSAHSITLTNNTVIGGYYGITFNGPTTGTGSANNVFSNNTVIDYHLYGMYLRAMEASIIHGNNLTRPNRTTTGSFYGIYCLAGNWNGTEISANRIHNSLGMAASSTSLAYPLYFSGVAGTEEEPVNVFNNVVYNINNSGVQYGIYVLGATTQYINFYHNSISLANTQATGTSAIRGFWQSVAGSGPVVLKNNIFHIENGNNGVKYGIYITSTAAQVTSNNNVLSMQSTTGTSNIGYFGTDYSTLSAWQSAGFDSLSVTSNPQFVSAQLNLTPQNPAIKGLGENLTATVPVDIGGTVRSTTPDPGAVEFTVTDCAPVTNIVVSAITNDGATVSWDSPGTSTLWDIEYGPQGFIPTGVPTVSGVSNPFAISGLDPATTYEVYVRADCGASGTSIWTEPHWMDPVTFTTLDLCPAVSDIEVDDITSESVLVSWTDLGYALSWDIEYGELGFTPTGIPSVSGVTNPYTITGLNELSFYDVYVRANCGVDGTSFWTGPVSWFTLCAPPDLTVLGDTVCQGGTAMLSAGSLDTAASFAWYDQPEGGDILFEGDVFEIPGLQSTSTFYVSSVSGTVPIPNSLFTQNQGGNSCGGGVMFDILPNQDIAIDSFYARANATATNTTVNVYTRMGTYLGNELNPGAWTLHATINIPSTTSGQLFNIQLPTPIEIYEGELTGIYLNYNSAYTNVTGPTPYSNADLTLTVGSGLCGQFTGNNANRGFNGEVFYRAGFGCVSPRMPVTAVVEPAPMVNLGADVAFCEGDSILLEGPEGFDEYLWTITTTAGIDFSTAQSLMVAEAGTYALAVTSSQGCIGSDTFEITLTPLPQFEVVASATEVCMGDDVTLTASGANLVFSWSHDVENGVAFMPIETTTYTVTAINAEGCTSEQQIIIVVNEYPEVMANASATEVCAGDMVTLTGSGAESYEWSHGVTDGEPFTIEETTTFTVVGTANGCSSEAEVTIVVNPIPEVSLTPGVDSVCIESGSVNLTGGSPAGGDWSGTGVTGSIFDPSDLEPGVYTITYTFTDANGCTAEAQADIVVQTCVSIRDITLTNVAVYPNPFEQFVDVTWKQLPGMDAQLRIIDMTGRTLMLTTLDEQQASAGTYRLELNSLAAGSYILELRSGGAVFRSTMVKMK